MCERFANWLVGWFIAWFVGAFLAGCAVRFELITVPDKGTQDWIAATANFDAEVKKVTENHEQRIRALEQKGEGEGI